MKKLMTAILLALLVVGAAYAGPALDFELSSVTNSATKSLGSSYEDFFCQITERTGNDNVILSLQGSGLNITGDDRLWVDMVNSTVVNSTTAATNSASWQFQSQDYYERAIRVHVIANTTSFIVNGSCWPGGR